MKIHIANDIVFRDLAGEAVILNLTTGTYFGLDEVGTRIWHLLAEHGSTDEVLTRLLAEYTVDEGQLRHDVDDLIGQLRAKGLVHTEDNDAPSVG